MGPAIAGWLLAWAILMFYGLSWLLAAFPAGFAGAAVYRFMERRVPEHDD